MMKIIHFVWVDGTTSEELVINKGNIYTDVGNHISKTHNKSFNDLVNWADMTDRILEDYINDIR